VLQTVGDAISDLLAVELILASRDWDVETWNKQYTDLPNRQIKVKVRVVWLCESTSRDQICMSLALGQTPAYTAGAWIQG